MTEEELDQMYRRVTILRIRLGLWVIVIVAIIGSWAVSSYDRNWQLFAGSWIAWAAAMFGMRLDKREAIQIGERLRSWR
jgi:hypothetical protein